MLFRVSGVVSGFVGGVFESWIWETMLASGYKVEIKQVVLGFTGNTGDLQSLLTKEEGAWSRILRCLRGGSYWWRVWIVSLLIGMTGAGYLSADDLTVNGGEGKEKRAVVVNESLAGFHGVPAEFRFSGEYELVEKSKVSAGDHVVLPVAPLRFHLFTDGESVRIYLAAEAGVYSEYQIYRKDGVQVLSDGGQTSELVPGVQAMASKGPRLKHLCVTKGFFQLTDFPGHSDQINLMRARRIEVNGGVVNN